MARASPVPEHPPASRRRWLCAVAVAPVAKDAAAAVDPVHDWHGAAVAMRRLAESWGDQSYGAVVVRQGVIVGLGPSRVVRDADPDAHAERVAIRDAQARDGPDGARGATLVSTSRPCAACERAAARAGIVRMVHGDPPTEGGAPRADR